MLKNDVFDKTDYTNNSNSKLWPILAGYLTLTVLFDNMIQDSGERICILYKNHWPWGENQDAPL